MSADRLDPYPHRRRPPYRWATRTRIDQERGAVAGLDGLMFAIMILLGGLVLIINAWSVIESRMVIDAAAREYVRTYTRGSDSISARIDAEHAARRVIGARRSTFDFLDLVVDSPNGFGPCATVTVSLSTRVPSLRAPFLGSFGSMAATSRLTGLVDAHRQMVPDATYDPSRTECFGE